MQDLFSVVLVSSKLLEQVVIKLKVDFDEDKSPYLIGIFLD